MTLIAAQPRRATPDDVLRLEDEGLFELVDGQLVDQQMSSLASETAGIITSRLVIYGEQLKVGKVYPEQTFQCFAHEPDLVRRPEVAFILSERLASVPEEGHVPIAPDLAIEVVSPNDKVYELDEKLSDYRAAGVKLVWIVNPKLRTVRVIPLGQRSLDLDDTGTLTAEPVLPGFSMAVRDLLPAAPASAKVPPQRPT